MITQIFRLRTSILIDYIENWFFFFYETFFIIYFIAEFENDLITEKIIACCFKKHRELGSGFPEKIYERALQILIGDENILFERQKEYVVFNNNRKVGMLRCDLVVNGKVVLELKSITGIMPVLFRNQLISYLRASGVKTGLLINFGNKSCEVKRVSVWICQIV